MRDALSVLHQSIDSKEREGWDAFVAEHKGCRQYVSGNGISVRLAGDTIGGYVIVIMCQCGVEENITNFDNW